MRLGRNLEENTIWHAIESKQNGKSKAGNIPHIVLVSMYSTLCSLKFKQRYEQKMHKQNIEEKLSSLAKQILKWCSSLI